tara:strand:+ start:23934 stop:24851 length:918 start_codon:yes stop_codon:yes gene_type:complete
MINKLLTLIESLLGKGKKLRNEETAFHCPFCHHHKKKLQINLNTQLWQCWVCGAKGRKIYQLFRKLKASKKVFEKLNDYTGDSNYNPKSDKKYDNINLPLEYKKLTNVEKNNPEFRNALHYLRNRNVTKEDILKYDIGYCENGPYTKMVIIPSYDTNGELNFFTGRSYYKEAPFKHKNPQVSKDIIGFELYINWQEPIVLVEGVFDAMAVKRNVIPLFGKLVLDKLKKMVVENKVKNIYVALDKDARKKALDVCEYFYNNGINVYLVDLEEQDPSDLGFGKITKIIKDTKLMTQMDLMQMKIMGV